jgi:hypothetical protein
MNNKQNFICEQRGAALITVLLIMALMTILGVSATDTTNFELQIANNDKRHKIVKYHVDAGFGGLAKFINQSMYERSIPTGTGSLQLQDNAEAIYDQLMHFADYNANLDLEYVLDGTHIDLDVFQFDIKTGGGGGSSTVEFITGAKSSGAKSGGGANVDTHFIFRAWGQDAQGTTSYIEANYIKPRNNSAGGL